MSVSERTNFLRNVSLFEPLKEKDLQRLIDDFYPRKYAAGDTIFHQGDSDSNLYIVFQGKVRIFSISFSGCETTHNIFARHDVIGEFAALDDLPRSATARTLEDCVLLEMRQERFLQRMREMPDLALAVSRLLVKKLRWTTSYAETIAQYGARGRLLHILLLYTERFGDEAQPGQHELDLGMTHAGLASLVGVRREWVSRRLKEWSKNGWLKYKRGKITILDLHAMQDARDKQMAGNDDDVAW